MVLFYLWFAIFLNSSLAQPYEKNRIEGETFSLLESDTISIQIPSSIFANDNGLPFSVTLESPLPSLVELGNPLPPLCSEYGFRSLYVTVVGELAYVGSLHSGLKIMNISDLENPIVLSTFQTFLSLRTIFNTKYEDFDCLYISGLDEGFLIFNVTDPFKPELVESFPEIKAVDMEIDDEEGFAYIINEPFGFVKMNLSSREFVSAVETTGSSYMMFLEKKRDLLYVTDRTNGLLIYNVSNPKEKIFPTRVGYYPVHYPIRVLVRDIGAETFAYVSTDENYLLVLSVTDPYNVTLVSEKSGLLAVYDSFVTPDEKYLLTADLLNGLSVLDISTLDIVGSVSSPLALTLNTHPNHEDILFLSDGSLGMRIINISSVTEPEIIFTSETIDIVSMFVEDGLEYLYLVSPSAMFIFELNLDDAAVNFKSKNPSVTPTLLHTIYFPGPDFQGDNIIVMGDSFAYISSSLNNSILVYDVSDKSTEPSILDLWTVGKNYSNSSSPVLDLVDFAISDPSAIQGDDSENDLIYIHFTDRLRIFNTSESKVRPNLVGEIPDLNDIECLFIRDRIIYVCLSGERNVTIFDSSDTQSIFKIGHYEFGVGIWEFSDIYVDPFHQSAFVSSENFVFVLNISDPVNPIVETSFAVVTDVSSIVGVGYNELYSGSMSHDEAIGGNFLFVAHQSRMEIADVTVLSDSELLDEDIYFGLISDGRVGKIISHSNYIFAVDIAFGFKVFRLGDITVDITTRSDGDDEGLLLSCGSLPISLRATDIQGNYDESETFVYFDSLCAENRSSCSNEFFNCSCFDGYFGGFCEDFRCFDVIHNNPLVCSERGSCIEDGNCRCDEKYFGDNCQYWSCFNISSIDPDVCGSHGSCERMDTCQCFDGYNSIELNGVCNEWFCGVYRKEDTDSVCNGRGECVESHSCLCHFSYEGDLCETWSCGFDQSEIGLVCSGNGECVSPNECDCRFGYIGERCETNSLIFTVMIPVLTFVSLLVCVCVFCVFLFVVFLACFCFFLIMVLFVSGLTFLISVVLKQRRGIQKFSRLKNFDLLLKEQELDSDPLRDIARLEIDRKLFSIDFEELKLVRILGTGGSNSTVYESIWQKQKVAFKCFKTRTVCSSQHSFDEFEREVQLMASLSHPHVIRFFGASLHPPRVGIVMEFCEHGELLPFFGKWSQNRSNNNAVESKHHFYPLEEKIRMLSEITSAFVYLHSRSIIHRDLKTENVLVDSKESVKVMDFGLSKFVESLSKGLKTTRIGTSYYMAPELVLNYSPKGDGAGYDEKCDVFSFGILIWVVVTEDYFPYGKSDKDEDVDLMSNNIEIKVATNPSFRPSVPVFEKNLLEKYFSQERRTIRFEENYDWLKYLMISCWSAKSVDRKGFNQISDIFESRRSVQKISTTETSSGNYYKIKKSLQGITGEKEKEEEDDEDESRGLLRKWKNVLEDEVEKGESLEEELKMLRVEEKKYGELEDLNKEISELQRKLEK